MLLHKWTMLIGIIYLCFSCKADIETEHTVFINFENITLKTLSNQGFNSHNITDIWIYNNGILRGAFETQKTVAILSDGNLSLDMYASVKHNGSSISRQHYILYDKFSINYSINGDTTITIEPTFTYKNHTTFHNIDFNNTQSQMLVLYKDSSTTAKVSTSSIGALDGPFLNVQTTDTNIIGYRTHKTYPYTSNTSSIFVEIDICSNILTTLYLDIFYTNGTKDTEEIYAFYPTEKEGIKTWKKLYLNLLEISSTLNTIHYQNTQNPINYFELSFRTQHTENTYAYIDNLKVVSIP